MIIGITGHQRHGKDTAADVFVTYGYKRYQFSEKMKTCLLDIFGWDRKFIEEHKEEIDPEWGVSPRQVLRAFGTEFAQGILCNLYPKFKEQTGRKLWAHSLLREIPYDQDAVISDVRFLHEVEEIRKRKGIIVKVARPSFPVDLSHASEQEIVMIREDFLIENDGTLGEFRGKVASFIQEMKL
jgi:hypothetical protein